MPTTAHYAPKIACKDQAWQVETAREQLNARRALIRNARIAAKPVTLWSRIAAWLNSDV
jgi:hypothetical protein